ncbi:MAG: alpha/beta hydrolase [Chloroflexota bacterium]
MSAITTDGNLVHYEVLGRGRPVILVHGWLGSWRYWIPTLQVLQNKYRVYALDLYGFGDSAKNPKQYGVEQQIALLDDFMHQLGMPKAALIGHGLGAVVVAEFARRFPDRIPRILIASTPLFDPGDLEKRVPSLRPARPLAQTGKLDANALNIAVSLSSTSAVTSASASAAMRAALNAAAMSRTEPRPRALQTIESAAVSAAQPTHNPLFTLLESSTPDALLARCFRRSEESYNKLSVDVAKIDPQALPKSVESFDSGRMLDTLRLLTIPVLAIHGADDPLLPQPNEAVLNYITQDKENLLLPILLPNVRHFPMLEDDRFARLASEFLEAPDMSKLAVKERWRRRTR